MNLNICVIFSVAISSAFFSCGDGAGEANFNIVPKPQSLIAFDGHFRLDEKTTFWVQQPEAQAVAEFFAEKIRRSTGFGMKFSEKEDNLIALALDETFDLTNEGYALDVSENVVVVTARTPAGLFYGMQSFMQLLPPEIESREKAAGVKSWTARCVTIEDEPRFEYRGMMLDPCRHFMTVDEVKKQLDAIALFKINRLHWHLTDDQGWRIEIKRYPKLTAVGSVRTEGEGGTHGGFYTQDEVREIVRYAAERFITVIPEIELPGHEMAAIAGYPELCCTGRQHTPRIVWGVEDIVLCAGKESTFEFLENVFAEIIDLFPSEYIHIGGDECPKSEWKKCPLCQKRIRDEKLEAADGHTAEERLQSYFVQRMEKVLAKYGKKIIGWDEILEGGLAPTATVMSWRGERGGVAAASMGHDVIMTPSPNGMYIDQFQGDSKIEPVSIGGYTLPRKIYDYNPVPDTLVGLGKDGFIKGVQCNVWAEYLYTGAIREYRTFPRILALSETAWTNVENKDYDDFERRLNLACERLDRHDINYHIPQPEQPFGSANYVAFVDTAVLAFKTTRPMKMVYTLDGTDPQPSSTEYREPLRFVENAELKIRSVMQSGKMSPVRTIAVEKQALSPAAKVDGLKPGLLMLTIDGMYLNTSEMPSFDGLYIQDGAGTPNDREWRGKEIKSLRELTNQVARRGDSMRDVNQYAAIALGYFEVPEDGVYFVSSDLEEVRIDDRLVVNNRGEVKRYSRRDGSIALSKGFHKLNAVFLGHIIGGWPSNWGDGSISLRRSDAEKFSRIRPEQLFYGE